MEHDRQKIDEVTLALLYLVTTEEHGHKRAWKGFDWDTLNRLHVAGYISDPRSKNKSVALSDEGAKLSAELFIKLFGTSD